jgi:AmiR/NasT family two-component response regulator
LTNETNSDPAEAIARHVDGVLRPTQTRRILEQVLSEMEEEIEERRLVGEAKQILQALHRVSEEQAHTRLRLLSRQSRKRLKEVAQQVIEEQHLLKGKSA